MKYLIPGIIFLLTIIIILVLAQKKDKNFKALTKILSIVYFILVFINIVLPDSFIMSKDREVEIIANRNYLQVFLRWFNYMSVIILPIASFFNNKTMRNIAIYFCLPVAILNVIFIYTYVPYFTSIEGRGINNISSLPPYIKAFFINEIFRTIWFSLLLLIELIIPLVLLIFEKHRFTFKDKNEIKNYLLVLLSMLLLMVPIYIPQVIFGFSNIIFKAYGIIHIGWLLFIVVEIILLIKIFKNKSYEEQYILCLILALVTLFQYNSMFSLTISFKRLPLQLCNLASYLIVIAIITKNKHIFNFNFIVNALGALIAILMPDLDNKGIFNVWNMHFITEHTHILIVPILALTFKIFPRIDKDSLKDAFIGFSIYFVFCLVFGTFMNGLVKMTGETKFEVNYLFMFDMKKATEVLSFIKGIATIEIAFGKYFICYPVVQILVYVVYFSLCIGVWLLIKLIYKLYDERNKKDSIELIN